jgi:hypothetical protein
MVAVPVVTPVTIPAELMVAIIGLLLLHIPPPVVVVSVVVWVWHTAAAPAMAEGPLFTVTLFVAVQPVAGIV